MTIVMKKLTGILLAAMLLLTAACEQSGGTGQEGTEQGNTTGETTVQTGRDGTDEEQSGTEQVNSGENGAAEPEDYDKIMSDKSLSPADLLAYIKKNISRVSEEQATNLVLKLEQLQADDLPEMTDRYSKADQAELLMEGVYDFDSGEIKMDSIKNENLRGVLTDAEKNGYKTETAEADFFPVIDYGIYESFGEKLPEDMKSYYSLMAVESRKAPAKDGGLVIGWDEVFKRAAAQESFVQTFSQSQKLDKVKELYRKYINFIFDGSNLPNTKHFAYDTKIMEPRMKESIIKAAENGGNTPLEKMTAEYLKVLKKNNYKLTAEVEQFRKNAAEQLDPAK